MKVIYGIITFSPQCDINIWGVRWGVKGVSKGEGLTSLGRAKFCIPKHPWFTLCIGFTCNIYNIFCTTFAGATVIFKCAFKIKTIILNLGPGHNHFWCHRYYCFRFWSHLVFHRLQPSTGWSPIYVLTPDHSCLTPVIGRGLVKPCHDHGLLFLLFALAIVFEKFI